MSGWRYFATKLNGDGTETMLADDLPIQDAEIIDDLSGPGALTGAVSPEVARLKVGNRPILKAWSTAIYAEKDGRIRGGGILTTPTVAGPTLDLECVGFTGYAADMPYTSEYSKTGVDPLDVVRHIWAHLQGKPGGNLGLAVDDTKSPVRIGGAASSEEGTYKLNWWSTDDLGEEFNKLAAETPFDYRVEHTMSGEVISHKLILGYPRLGRRRHDLRFVVGENVMAVPEIGFGADNYADEVLVLGAGEGRTMIRATASRPSDRLRRVAIVEAKNLRKKNDAAILAQREVKRRTDDPEIADEITLTDHPHARIGSYAVGDEILLQTPAGWTEGQAEWHRILSMTLSPEANTVTLTIARAEKVT